FAVARLHGAWTRGLLALGRGEEELEEFLVDRISAHGGRCMLDDRATQIVVRRGAAAGVLIDGDDRPTGASFIVADTDGEGIAAFTGGEGINKRAQRGWPRITSGIGRFVMSLLVRREGVPEPLGAESFVLPAARSPSRRAGGRPPPPIVHLQRAAVAE